MSQQKMVKVRVEAGLYRQVFLDGTEVDRKRGDEIEIEEKELKRVPHAFKLLAEIEDEKKKAERPLVDDDFERRRSSVRANFESQKQAARITADREVAEAIEAKRALDEKPKAATKK